MKGEFYKMEYDAWDEGTDDLTLEQEAAYLRLCHQMYRHRAPVPNRLPRLARLWRCHPNKARKLLQDLIDAGKIHPTQDGHLTNTRVRQELDARETLSTHRSDAGQTGGRRSGDTRRKPLKTNDSGEAIASDAAKQNEAEKRREEERREESRAASQPRDAREATPHRDRAFFDDLERRCREAAGLDNDPSPSLCNLAPIIGLLDAGLELDEDVLPVLRARSRAGQRGRTWGYYTEAIKESAATRRGVAVGAQVESPEQRERRQRLAAERQIPVTSNRSLPESTIRLYLAHWKRTGSWSVQLGSPPGTLDCMVPADLLDEYYRAVAASGSSCVEATV